MILIGGTVIIFIFHFRPAFDDSIEMHTCEPYELRNVHVPPSCNVAIGTGQFEPQSDHRSVGFIQFNNAVEH